MNKRHWGILAILACYSAVGLTQSTDGLPVRSITIGGAQFSTDAYVDMGTFERRIFPLDDRGLIDNPQLAVMCFSPWAPPSTFSLFAHMPTVDFPIVWYYPLTYQLGDWKYEYGDTLTCQLWDCDGGPGGCDPAKPTALPSATAGDDLVGAATLSLGSFQIVGASLLNMTVPVDGKGKVGTQSASILFECPGCRQLWRQNTGWVSPFLPPQQQQQQQLPAVEGPSPIPSTSPDTSPLASNLPSLSVPPPAPLASSPPATELPPTNITPPPVGSFDGPPAAEEQQPPAAEPIIPQEPAGLPVPPVLDTPPPMEPPVAPVPPPVNPPSLAGDEELPSKDVEDVPIPEPAEVTVAKKNTKTTLIVVLSVLGGLLAILLVTAAGCLCVRCWGWKAIAPEPMPEPKGAEAGPSRRLRIRVQRPADADAALRQHHVEGAIAELPWAPRMN